MEEHNMLHLSPSSWQLTRLIVVTPLIVFCSWGLGLHLQGHDIHKHTGAPEQLILPLKSRDALQAIYKAAVLDGLITQPHPLYLNESSLPVCGWQE